MHAYMLYTELAETAAVLRGTSNVIPNSPVSASVRWIWSKTSYKKLQSLIQDHGGGDSSVVRAPDS